MHSIKKLLYFLTHHSSRAISLKFSHLSFCQRKRQEVCVMQLIGKNSFPTYTPYEIIKSPDILKAISAEDAIIIAQLDEKIRQDKKRCKILEFDRNGTLLLRNEYGKTERMASRLAAKDTALINRLDSLSAFKLGLRVNQQSVH